MSTLSLPELIDALWASPLIQSGKPFQQADIHEAFNVKKTQANNAIAALLRDERIRQVGNRDAAYPQYAKTVPSRYWLTRPWVNMHWLSQLEEMQEAA